MLVALLPVTVGAQEVTVFPHGPVYLYPANPDRGYVDAVVHAVAFINTSSHPVRLTQLRIEAITHDMILAAAGIPLDEVLAATRDQVEMRQQGMAALADMTIPVGSLPQGTQFVANAMVPPHGALLTPARYLAVSGQPTMLRIRASVTSPDGHVREIVDTVPAIVPQYRNQYTMPLKGTWFARSIPNITSHHRWNAQTEFAMDFWKVDSLGSPARGSGDAPDDYYAYGQPVFAALDGVVVAAENGATQDYVTRRRRAGESDDDYRQRITKFNMGLMINDPHRGIIGNYVVIQHANGEFSAYGHLKTGSVTVTVGEAVRRGQQIGQVGDTGDSPLVHLHFQISDGPDPLAARSLPFRFVDATPDDIELGTFIASGSSPSTAQ